MLTACGTRHQSEQTQIKNINLYQCIIIIVIQHCILQPNYEQNSQANEQKNNWTKNKMNRKINLKLQRKPLKAE